MQIFMQIFMQKPKILWIVNMPNLFEKSKKYLKYKSFLGDKCITFLISHRELQIRNFIDLGYNFVSLQNNSKKR